MFLIIEEVCSNFNILFCHILLLNQFYYRVKTVYVLKIFLTFYVLKDCTNISKIFFSCDEKRQ